MSKIYIITGHYGSGKSEFAVNFAKHLNKQNHQVCLADLDVINPYFRSREVRGALNDLGITVVSDLLDSVKGLDMPYVSPAIQGYLANSSHTIILDCGGDHVGIRVLKQYLDIIKKRDYEMLMLVNTYRPETSNVDDIIKMKDALETESELKVSGYVNNSNFLRHTTQEDIINADHIIGQVSEITHLPIFYVSGLKNIIETLPDDVKGKRLTLDLSLRSEWM